VKLSSLYRGLPGHPLHPPLTDATIGIYTLATVAAFLSVIGVSEGNTAVAWWLALTGLAEWLTISRGTPLWRTATSHLLAMVSATVLFLIAVLAGHGGYVDRAVETGPFILTLAGFAVMTLGGFLGGTIVFVHGMRVLNLVDEPARRAATPLDARKGVSGKIVGKSPADFRRVRGTRASRVVPPPG
jgi:uncharacterized membrane protein